MFQNILIPVDLSERSLDAVREGIRIAGDEAAITLLHVIETGEGIDFSEIEDFYKGLENKAERVMADWCGDLTGGERLDRLVFYGRRTREILRVAEERDCDLIIVCSHRFDTEHPGGGLGTISHQIGLLAGCSVMLLR